MQTGTFRKNVIKTVATKPAKLGLRVVSKSTARTNVAHAVVLLAAHVGVLLSALTHYLLGMQFTKEMEQNAFTAMGDVGYDLTALCRHLKVKMPSATKKSKLMGTRAAAMLHLSGLTADMLMLTAKGLFGGPAMTTVKKMVVLPNKNGAKEERDVEVVDANAENAADTARQTNMKSLLAGAVDIYWRLCFDIFKKGPADLFEDKFARMKKEFPGIEFDTAEEPDEAEEGEKQAEPAATPAQ